MVYTTDDTEWPGFDFSTAIKKLISDFFLILDSEDKNAGDQLADNIFAADGTAFFGGYAFVGTEEIRKSRDNSHQVVSRRRHKVVKVFSASLTGDDLLFIGHVEMDFKNGKSVDGEFTGRLSVTNENSDSPRLTLYKVWADSAPVTKALRGE